MGVGCIPSSPPPPPFARPASVIESEEERKEGGQLRSLLCEGSRQQQSIALLYHPLDTTKISKLDLILLSSSAPIPCIDCRLKKLRGIFPPAEARSFRMDKAEENGFPLGLLFPAYFFKKKY